MRAASTGRIPPEWQKMETDVGAAGKCAVHEKASNGAGGIKNEFDHVGRNAGNQICAGARFGRMNENDGFAAIEFVEYRGECRIARPFIVVTRLQVRAVRS